MVESKKKADVIKLNSVLRKNTLPEGGVFFCVCMEKGGRSKRHPLKKKEKNVRNGVLFLYQKGMGEVCV